MSKRIWSALPRPRKVTENVPVQVGEDPPWQHLMDSTYSSMFDGIAVGSVYEIDPRFKMRKPRDDREKD